MSRGTDTTVAPHGRTDLYVTSVYDVVYVFLVLRSASQNVFSPPRQQSFGAIHFCHSLPAIFADESQLTTRIFIACAPLIVKSVCQENNRGNP